MRNTSGGERPIFISIRWIPPRRHARSRFLRQMKDELSSSALQNPPRPPDEPRLEDSAEGR